MSKKSGGGSAFDQVFASCQEEYAEKSAQAASRSGWQPPHEWRGSFAIEEVEEEGGENDKGQYVVVRVKCRIMDGEEEGKAFTRSLFLPGPGIGELASLAACLAGEPVDDVLKARSIVRESGPGSVIKGASKWKPKSNGQGDYKNLYYNEKVA